jgi:hypothetical protein
MLFKTATGIPGWVRRVPPSAGLAVTPATSPHRGQAAAPLSNEKQQPQKQATSIIDTFLLCALQFGPTIPAGHVTGRVR